MIGVGRNSRFVAFWATAEKRARICFWVAAVQTVLLALALFSLIRVLARPREVIRVGCDGIPQLVQINEVVYSEPAEQEIRAFASGGSSVVNDLAYCMRRMTPELRERFKALARGSRERPGLVSVIESLKRRTQIDPGSLEVKVDKRSYPWRAVVKGARQVVGQPPEGASRSSSNWSWSGRAVTSSSRDCSFGASEPRVTPSTSACFGPEEVGMAHENSTLPSRYERYEEVLNQKLQEAAKAAVQSQGQAAPGQGTARSGVALASIAVLIAGFSFFARGGAGTVSQLPTRAGTVFSAELAGAGASAEEIIPPQPIRPFSRPPSRLQPQGETQSEREFLREIHDRGVSRPPRGNLRRLLRGRHPASTVALSPASVVLFDETGQHGVHVAAATSPAPS